MEKLLIEEDENILIVAPHPDDECIGMGGFLWMYGKQCDVWVVSDGSKGRQIGNYQDCVDVRRKEFEAEMKFYQVKSFKMWGLPDGELTQFESYFNEISLKKYNKIFVVNGNDESIDHRAVFRMIVNSLKNTEENSIELYQYEVNYPLPVVTNYLDITDALDGKKRGIDFHTSQLKIFDHKTVSLILNRYRAAFTELKEGYVEAYCRTYLSDIADNVGFLDKALQAARRRHYIDSLLCDVLLEQNRLFEVLCKEKSIYIYGYGVYGRRIEKITSKVSTIKAIIDQNKGGNGNISDCGVDIINLEMLEYGNELVIVAIIDKDVCERVGNELNRKKIRFVNLDDFLENILNLSW